MLSPSPPGAAADAAAAAAAIAESVDRPTKLADVPDAFFARNEAPFRGMIHPERAAAEYADVDAAAEALAAAARDGAAGEYELVHDLINNALYFKDAKKKATGKKKTEAAAEATEAAKVEAAASEAVAMAAFEAAVDRNRKSLPNRFITARVRDATARYLEACADATAAVRRELQGLCEEVEAELPALTTAAHWSLVSSALAAHVECGVGKGWALPTLLPSDADARALRLDGAWPYWLSRDAAVANDVDWEGLWLLTAPNMAGKSSLMRTMAVSALLANAGLMAPVKSAAVPRYDKYFVRVAAFDAPAEEVVVRAGGRRPPRDDHRVHAALAGDAGRNWTRHVDRRGRRAVGGAARVARHAEDRLPLRDAPPRDLPAPRPPRRRPARLAPPRLPRRRAAR